MQYEESTCNRDLSERLDPATVRRQFESFIANNCSRFMDALPDLVLVLNRCRQVVFANESVLGLAGADDVTDVLGQRPGEVVDCIHARIGKGGCGTSKFCSQCGALSSILSALQQQRNVKECHILRNVNGRTEAMDLQVHSVPFDLDGELYTIFSVKDISHEMRRRALERIFFHDILNLAGGLKGLASLFKEDVPPSLARDAEIFHISLENLFEEVETQRQLMAAESGELCLELGEHAPRDILESVIETYRRHPLSYGRSLQLDSCSANFPLLTDASLLRRVVGNMVKNALEATRSGGTVNLACAAGANGATFTVWNDAVIPEDMQLKLFKRSHSTKGKGRGLGTYSMLLLSERYLGGKVSFESRDGEGTVFRITVPARIEVDEPDAVKE